MQAHLILSRLKHCAYHGVLPQERAVGAYFYTSLDLTFEVTSLALEEDDLRGTINYAEVAEVVTEEMKQASDLLEHVAYRIGKRLFREFPAVQTIEILLEKENPPTTTALSTAGIKLTLHR